MSTIQSAMADTSKLSKFDGLDVLATGVALTGAGDGLSKALAIDPVELHQGDEVYVLTKAIVQKVRFEPIDKDNPRGPQRRVHMLRAGTATIVDPDFAKGKIEDQERLIREAQEAAKGIVPIPEVVAAEKAHAETGRKPVPAAPAQGETDSEGFHDPALAEHPSATPTKAKTAKKAGVAIGKAAKLAAVPEATDG